MQTAAKPKWKVLARHKTWVSGATITETIRTPDDGERTYRRYTATINGFTNWKAWEGFIDAEVGSIVDVVAQRVEAIKRRIDTGDDAVFHEKNAAERSVEILEAKRLERRERTTARLLVGKKMRTPTAVRKHMVAINSKNVGYFIVDNWRERLNRETFKEIIAEAQTEGCKAPYFIYGAYTCYMGANIEFLQFSIDEYR